jgi:ADP-ribose pyrophosphatase YjhB (NUDIX family)
MSPVRLPYEEYRRIYSQVPRLCVDLIVRTEDGVLLARRDIDPGRGLWHLPGGTVLLGESLHQAARRVGSEEVGLSILSLELLGFIEFLPETNPFFHAVTVAFRAVADSREPRALRETAEIGWFLEDPEPMVREQREFLLDHGLLQARTAGLPDSL